MKTLIVTFVSTLIPLAAVAGETSAIDPSKLPAKQVHEVAEMRPLAVTAEGAPAVALLDLDSGDVVPPHAAKSGLRLLTVLAGEMSWGDGKTIDVTKETVYPAGTILTVPAGVDHWLAARNGDVRVQMVLIDDEKPIPAVVEQMK